MKIQHNKLALAVLVLLVMLAVGCIDTSKKSAVADTTPAITGTSEATPSVTVTTPDGTIKLAAFNLQVFGTTKAGKPEVMGVLSKIIRNYDVIAVQEIRDSSQTSLPKLRDTVNSM